MLAARPAGAQGPPAPDDRYVLRARVPLDVKDFGAVGDGSTDDTPSIQAAIIAGTGGAVFLPPGRYSITGLDIPSDTELFGAGWNSVLALSASPALYALRILAGAHDVRLHDFAIDGNKSGIASAHSDWDPDSLNGGPSCILIADGLTGACRRIYVDRLRQFDSFRLGIVFRSVVDGAIRDCSVENNNRDGITLYHDTKNVAVRGNTILGCGDDHIGINSENESPYGHLCESIVVTDNTMIGPSTRAKGRGITVRGGKDLVIANNVIRDVSQSAIWVEDFATTPATDIEIAGNEIYRSGEGGSFDKIGISVQCGGSVVQRLNILGNMLRATHEVAIRLNVSKSSPADDDIRDVLIAHNSVEDSGQQGIDLRSAGINDVTIAGNRVKGSAADGISSMSGAKRVNVRENVVYRGAGYGIRLSIADSGSCEGNQVYDDRAGSATQTYGIDLNALGGVWAFRDNTVWGHVHADYDLHQGSHAARFEGPYRTLFGTTGWEPPPLLDGMAAITTVAVTGAAVGDPCTVGMSTPIQAGLILTASVSAPDTVAVTLLNKSGAVVDVPGATVWVHAEKPPPLP
jgi:polygalacturonase